jgi:hypothetical protein
MLRVAFAGELLEHLRGLLHGQGGPHGRLSGGVIPPSVRARRSSRSSSFPSSGLPGARQGLSRAASAIGTIAPRTGTIHQKLVMEDSGMHNAPKTKTYTADCQLIHEAPPRLGVEPRIPGAGLVSTSEDPACLPGRGPPAAASLRRGFPCPPPPPWARLRASSLKGSNDPTSPSAQDRRCSGLGRGLRLRPCGMLPPSRSVGPQSGLFHTGSVPDRVSFSRYASGGKPAVWAGYKVRNLRGFAWYTRTAAGGSLSTAGCVDERPGQ